MIPYSRPKLSDLYTLSQKTIPFTAAHTYIAHIWQYPAPAPPPGGTHHSVCTLFASVLNKNKKQKKNVTDACFTDIRNTQTF